MIIAVRVAVADHGVAVGITAKENAIGVIGVTGWSVGNGRNVVRSRRNSGFFARILRFFGFGGSDAPAGVREPRREYPAYQGRSGGGSGEGAERPLSSEGREPRQRAPRKPELLEVTTPKLYVGNLSYDAAESDLFELFSGVGNVKNAEVVTTKETDRSKGFGFVTMSTIEEAKRAVAELNEKEFMGRRMVVSGSRTTDRGERREESAAAESEGEAAA